jgi:hypothetical protein
LRRAVILVSSAGSIPTNHSSIVWACDGSRVLTVGAAHTINIHDADAFLVSIAFNVVLGNTIAFGLGSDASECTINKAKERKRGCWTIQIGETAIFIARNTLIVVHTNERFV